MSDDKTLTITKYGNTYEDENYAEVIRILLPHELNSHSLKECTIELNLINQDNVGDVYDISDTLTEYDDELYMSNIPMSNAFTYKSGKIQMWIKIINLSTNMIAKTNIVSYNIRPHIDIEGTIPQQSLSLLDEWVLKMNEILQETKESINSFSGEIQGLSKNIKDMNDYISELKKGSVLLVSPENIIENE